MKFLKCQVQSLLQINGIINIIGTKLKKIKIVVSIISCQYFSFFKCIFKFVDAVMFI